MLELAVTLIVLAMAVLSVAIAAKQLTYRSRARLAFIAAAMSVSGTALTIFSH
jgi:hypothetical protein